MLKINVGAWSAEAPLDAVEGPASQSRSIMTSSVTMEAHLTSYFDHTECDT